MIAMVSGTPVPKPPMPPMPQRQLGIATVHHGRSRGRFGCRTDRPGSSRMGSHTTINRGSIMTVRIFRASLECFRNACMNVRKPRSKPAMDGVSTPRPVKRRPATDAIYKEQVSLFTVAAAIDCYSPARASCEEFLIISSMSGRADLPLQALFENYQHWTSKFGLPKLSKQAFADVLWAVGCEVKIPDLWSKSRGCNRAAPRSRPKTSCNKQLSLPLGT